MDTSYINAISHYPRFFIGGIVAMLSILAGCETGVTTPDDIPYVEQIVVSCLLEPEKPADSLRFSRTLPITEKYDTSKAIITDLTGTIQSGDSIYPLRYVSGIRYQAVGLTPKSGKVYRLNVDWHGKHVTAVTRVPFPVSIDTITFFKAPNPRKTGDNYYRMDVAVRPGVQEVYGIGYVFTNGAGVPLPQGELNRAQSVARSQDTLADGRAHVISRGDSPLEGPPPFSGSVSLFSFDAPYYDYFLTYAHGDEPGDRVLANTGEKIRWNVHGDGVGMFIGRAIRQITL
ncbi:MAG: DUF4249 family protein [Candidatus Kapaibacterium sp.]